MFSLWDIQDSQSLVASWIDRFFREQTMVAVFWFLGWQAFTLQDKNTWWLFLKISSHARQNGETLEWFFPNSSHLLVLLFVFLEERREADGVAVGVGVVNDGADDVGVALLDFFDDLAQEVAVAAAERWRWRRCRRRCRRRFLFSDFPWKHRRSGGCAKVLWGKQGSVKLGYILVDIP